MSATATMSKQGTAAPAKASSGKTAEVEALPQELIDMLEKGRFAEYHLERARTFLAQKNFKLAIYQAKASLCHDQLPAARELLAEIKRQAKA